MTFRATSVVGVLGLALAVQGPVDYSLGV